MKVSEITNQEIADYLKLEYGDLTDTEKTNLNTSIGIARAFVSSYTGLAFDEVDTHEEFIIVIYVLCQDMYYNRCLYVDKNNLNRLVESVLGMHCTNLLPTPEEASV